jgi:small nuclear ribonucleoprotein (snRNP)-like protein
LQINEQSQANLDFRHNMSHRPESPAQGKISSGGEEETPETPAVAKARALLGKELRITITDGRIFIGNFACTDKDLNVVLTSSYEFPVGYQNDHLVENGRFVGMLMFPWRHVVRVEVHIGNGSSTYNSDEYS